MKENPCAKHVAVAFDAAAAIDTRALVWKKAIFL